MCSVFFFDERMQHAGGMNNKDAKRDEICAGQARVAAGRRQRGAAVRVRNTMLFVERSKRERTYGSVMRALMECLKINK
jgi:hypothetical protein